MQSENTAGAKFALHRKMAPHGLGDVFGKRQPQSRPVNLLRDNRGAAVKRLEHASQLRFGIPMPRSRTAIWISLRPRNGEWLKKALTPIHRLAPLYFTAFTIMFRKQRATPGAFALAAGTPGSISSSIWKPDALTRSEVWCKTECKISGTSKLAKATWLLRSFVAENRSI